MFDQKSKALLSWLVLCACFLIFGLSVLVRIESPLLWNDEAETAMFGERILQYGYPKIFDGKNIVYSLDLSDKALGKINRWDAYTVSGWTQYYVASIGVWLASHEKDLYVKTALVRLPFALLGILAVLLQAMLTASFITKEKSHQRFWISGFFLLEALSYSLILHLREARYYSILIFAVSLVLTYYAATQRAVKNHRTTWILGYLSLLFTVMTFPPAGISCILALIITEILSWKTKTSLEKSSALKKIFLPAGLALISITALSYFSGFSKTSTSYMSSLLSRGNDLFYNWIKCWSFFARYEFLLLILWLKYVLFKLRQDKTAPRLELSPRHVQALKLNRLITVFCLIHPIVISPILSFERYYIVMQPMLITAILLDGATLIRYLQCKEKLEPLKNHGLFLSSLLLFALVMIVPSKIQQIHNRIEDLKTPYRGVLDFAMPIIQSKYPDPSQLQIATNYEEYSYMYYLKCKTLVGFYGNNLKNDLKETPDIIIIRKQMGFQAEYFSDYFLRNEYEKMLLPVEDYPVNNIPEISSPLHHQTQTLLTQTQSKQLELFFKKNPSSSRSL